ncbi:MAG: hypothetical protein ACKOYH_04195 [Cyanobium sp.]
MAATPLSRSCPIRISRCISVGEPQSDYLMSRAERWTARMQLELQTQRERLKRLRGRQEEHLQLSFAADQRPQQIKEKRRLEQQKAIDVRFVDHERFVKR